MSVYNCLTNMKSNIVNQQNILDNSVLLKVELADGTTQLIQIPKVDVCNLGLQIQTEPKTVNVEPVPIVASNINGILPSSNVEISDKLHEDKASHYVYKVVKPEDLNLKPTVKTHLTRGRPKKRLKQNNSSDSKTVVEVEETSRVVKQARTRSGRITKPPKHIEKDFKKIDISDNSKLDLTDLKTSEFEPLRTNETPSEEPLRILEQHHKRKRNIPPRFRCPTCNKAYLGRIKMVNHFQKHPDHRSETIQDFINHTTWNFLILTSQKHKLGSKGIKFCEELEVLLQNARYLAHFLFKPLNGDDDGYFINENLAYLFGISPGKYSIDDSELGRDITLYEYLENNESNNEKCKTADNVRSTEVGNVKKESKNPLETKEFNTFDYIMSNEQNPVINFDASNTQQNIDDKNKISLNNISLSLEAQENHTNIEFTIPHTSHDVIIDKEQLKNNHSDSYIETENSNSTLSNGNCLALVKYEMQPKNNFIFNNHEFSNINSDLHNQLDNLADYNNLGMKEKSVFGLESSSKNHNESSEKQNSHITLQNELRDVDELMLVNVDAGQVSNMLDTSSNSDDIMNVDQFVNERFKKLTEPDIDIQNNLLNLELPPLDMFHFHTS